MLLLRSFLLSWGIPVPSFISHLYYISFKSGPHLPCSPPKDSKESTSVGWCTLHSEGHANSCCIQPWESEFNTPFILLFYHLPSISLSSFRTSSRVDQLCIYLSLKKKTLQSDHAASWFKTFLGILSIFDKIQILKQIYRLWGIPIPHTPKAVWFNHIVWEWANFFLL